jgi:hypothetical protein
MSCTLSTAPVPDAPALASGEWGADEVRANAQALRMTEAILAESRNQNPEIRTKSE